MESGEVFVLNDGIALESQPVDTLGKDNGTVECFETVVLNDYSRMSFSSMEILLLVLQVRYFRIDGDNRFRKLEEIGE